MQHMGSASKTRLNEQERRMRRVQKILGQQRSADSVSSSSSRGAVAISTEASNSMAPWRRNALGHWMQTISQKFRSSSDQPVVMDHGTLVDEVNRDISDLVTTACGKFMNISEENLRSSQGLNQFISQHVDVFRNVPDWMKVLAFLGTKKCKAVMGCQSTPTQPLPILLRSEPMSLDAPICPETALQPSPLETQGLAMPSHTETDTTACGTLQCATGDKEMVSASEESKVEEATQQQQQVLAQKQKRGQKKTTEKKTPQALLDCSPTNTAATKKRRSPTKSTEDAPLEHGSSSTATSPKKCKKEPKHKEKQVVARNAVLKEHSNRSKGHEHSGCSSDHAVCIGTEALPVPGDEGSSASSASSCLPVMLS
jgi:hypothetical protein